jgi:hypothetical protein
MTSTKINKPTPSSTPKPNATNTTTQNTKNTTPTHTTKNQNTQKMRVRSKDQGDQKDVLFFDHLLQTDADKKNQVNIVGLVQQQNQQNQQNQQENKQQSAQAELVQDIKILDVQKTHDINQAQTAQFESALADNHQQHYFEVTMPNIGKFNIQTQLNNKQNGKNLHFDISTQEQKAFDWLSTHQSSIAKNVGKDLNINVTLGLLLA